MNSQHYTFGSYFTIQKVDLIQNEENVDESDDEGKRKGMKQKKGPIIAANQKITRVSSRVQSMNSQISTSGQHLLTRRQLNNPKKCSLGGPSRPHGDNHRRGQNKGKNHGSIMESETERAMSSPMDILYCQEEFMKENEMNLENVSVANPIFIASDFTVEEQKQVSLEYLTELKRAKDKQFGRNLLESMKESEPEFRAVNFLDSQIIPPNTRTKMVDWLIEVMCSYKCCEETYFLTISLMDRYFQKAPCQELTDLHLIGVTCLFIANKYEEVYPIRLSTVWEKIGHQKLSKERIKAKELEILEVLDFQISGPRYYEFIGCTLNLIDIKLQLSEREVELLQKVLIYISKMVLYDYPIIGKYSNMMLAGGIIYVSLKILEQIGKNFNITENMQKVMILLELEEKALVETASVILRLAKNFDEVYPSQQNLKKYHASIFDELESEQLALKTVKDGAAKRVL